MLFFLYRFLNKCASRTAPAAERPHLKERARTTIASVCVGEGTEGEEKRTEDHDESDGEYNKRLSVRVLNR